MAKYQAEPPHACTTSLYYTIAMPAIRLCGAATSNAIGNLRPTDLQAAESPRNR